jgi:hypothetical protein
MATVEQLENIPNPDAAGLIPYFDAPADEPNPAEESK